MLTSSGYGAITPIAPAKVYRTRTGRDTRTQVTPGSSNYYSVTHPPPTQGSRYHMVLDSRHSQEVRTSTTTGDIAALRQQVASGTYTPDPMAIAARILFLGEGR